MGLTTWLAASVFLCAGLATAETPDVLIRTSFGAIPIVLDRSETPAADKLLDLARRKHSGVWNRAEPRPSTPGDPSGPYGLLQGAFDHDQMNLPKAGTKRHIRPGDIVLIPETNAFYLSLADHDDWATGHTVIGRATHLTIADVITVQETREYIHPEYGTRMQMLSSPVPFVLTDDVTDLAMMLSPS